MKISVLKNIDYSLSKFFRQGDFDGESDSLVISNYYSGRINLYPVLGLSPIHWGRFLHNEVRTAFPNREEVPIGRDLSLYIMQREVKSAGENGKLRGYTVTEKRMAYALLYMAAEYAENGTEPEDGEFTEVIRSYSDALEYGRMINDFTIAKKYSEMLRDEKYITSLSSRYHTLIIYGGERINRIQLDLIGLLAAKGVKVAVLSSPGDLITVQEMRRYENNAERLKELCPYCEHIGQTAESNPDIYKIEEHVLRTDMLSDIVKCANRLLQRYRPDEIAVLSTFADESMIEYISAKGTLCGKRKKMFFRDPYIRGVTAIASVYRGIKREDIDKEGIDELFLRCGIPFMLRKKITNKFIEGEELPRDEELWELKEFIQLFSDTERAFGELLYDSINMLPKGIPAEEYAAAVSQFIPLVREAERVLENPFDGVMYHLYEGGAGAQPSVSAGYFSDGGIDVITTGSLAGKCAEYKAVIVAGASSRNWVRSEAGLIGRRRTDTVRDAENISRGYENAAEIIKRNSEREIHIFSCAFSNEGRKNDGLLIIC